MIKRLKSLKELRGKAITDVSDWYEYVSILFEDGTGVILSSESDPDVGNYIYLLKATLI